MPTRSPRYNVIQVARFFKEAHHVSFRRAELRIYRNRDDSLYVCLSLFTVVDEVTELQGLRVNVHITVLKAMPHHIAPHHITVFAAAMRTAWAPSRTDPQYHCVQNGHVYDNKTAMFDYHFAPLSGHDLVMLELLRECPLCLKLRRCCEIAVNAAIAAGAPAALSSCCREDFHLSVKPTWIRGLGFWLMDA